MYPFSPKLPSHPIQIWFFRLQIFREGLLGSAQGPSLSVGGYVGMGWWQPGESGTCERKKTLGTKFQRTSKQKLADILPRVGIEALPSPPFCVPFSYKSLLFLWEFQRQAGESLGSVPAAHGPAWVWEVHVQRQMVWWDFSEMDVSPGGYSLDKSQHLILATHLIPWKNQVLGWYFSFFKGGGVSNFVCDLEDRRKWKWTSLSRVRTFATP